MSAGASGAAPLGTADSSKQAATQKEGRTLDRQHWTIDMLPETRTRW